MRPSLDRFIDALRDNGCTVIERGNDRAIAQAPGHSPADRSISILYNAAEGRTAFMSFADDKEQVLDALGLTWADLFDDPKGSKYEYGDGRTVHRSPDKRFRQSGNTKGRSLFRAERLADAEVVYMVEGEHDVLTLESEGVAATCTAMGAGKAHLFDLTPLHGKRVRIVRDMDAPGKAHALQVAELLAGHAEVSILEPAIGKDASDHITAGHGVDEFRSAEVEVAEAAVQRIRKFDAITDEWWKWLDDTAGSGRVVPTPWEPLNEILAGGLHPGRSYLIAGRPGGGKSLALTNIAAHAAENGHKGLLFSLEMGHIEIASRIIAAGANAEYGQITRRDIDAYNMAGIAEYLDRARGMPLWVCDDASITVDKIREDAREAMRHMQLDFVAVDYAQLLRPTDSRDTRERQIAEISRSLKILSKELDIAVVTACQLNRAPSKEKRPPTIAELRESGALEQDSDVIILLHHNTIEDMPTGEVDLIVGKNRTGKLATITLPWRAYRAKIG